jgi:DNA-binding response OmpR family regulator
MNTIFVVEDDLSLQETLVYNLRRQDYRVESVGDGQAAIDTARRLYPNLDLILLDLMLPKVDGFDVCKTLRKEMNVPILMLTARDEEIDRVLGLEIGADDYITKPFSMRELMARVKAHLRREQIHRDEDKPESPGRDQQILVFNNISIDIIQRKVFLDKDLVPLKPKEFELLLFMAQHRGKALGREFLLERVWDWEHISTTRTVDVHIHWLREKLEADPANPTRIVTVHGFGYRFEG